MTTIQTQIDKVDERTDDYLIKKREELIDKLTPNKMVDELLLLLEIERELTLREEDPR